MDIHHVGSQNQIKPIVSCSLLDTENFSSISPNQPLCLDPSDREKMGVEAEIGGKEVEREEGSPSVLDHVEANKGVNPTQPHPSSRTDLSLARA